MSKYEGHTPGPWHVGAFLDSGIRIAPNCDPKNATAYAFDEANAHLIADAPMLLAQRDKLARFLDECIFLLDRVEVKSMRAGICIERARDLLKEVEESK